MIFYHGTAAKHVADINAKGLIPGASRGADTYAHEVLHWSDRVFAEINARPAGVYLTRNRRIADWYARMAAAMNKSRPVILQVDVPDAEVGKLEIDEEGQYGADPTVNPFGGRWNGSIPPAWVVGTAPLEAHPDPLPDHASALLLGYADE